MINYIFQIGIIYIVFSLIWAFFLFIYNMLMGFERSSPIQTFIMKAIKSYFLISIVAIFSIEYMRDPRHSAPLIATVGLLTLYSYLVGRLQHKKLVVQMNSRFGSFNNAGMNADLRLESFLIVVSLVYFTLCLYNHAIPYNKINLWFYHSVNDIYKTPVIGWIIGFFGILFLLATLLKAILVTAMFIRNFQDIISGNKNKNNNGNDKRNDGDYTDYEIID